MEEVKNFKWYVKVYSEGKVDLFSELIEQERVEEENGYGKVDVVYRIRYRDIALQGMYEEFQNKYEKLIGLDEVESIFSTSLYEFIEKKAKHVVDEKSSGELLSWARYYIEGNLKREPQAKFGKVLGRDPDTGIVNHREFPVLQEYFPNDTTFDSKDDEQSDDELSTLDQASFFEYQKRGYTNKFKEFLSNVDVSIYLTDIQNKVYTLLIQRENYENVEYEGKLTYKQIGESLRIDESTVRGHRDAIYKKITELYNAWLTFTREIDLPLSRLFREFLNIHEYIKNCDPDFKFRFLIGWLKNYYTKGEQIISYKELHKNKRDDSETVFDKITEEYNAVNVLLGHLHDSSWRILYNILENDIYPINMRSQQKENIYNRCLTIFRNYIRDNKKDVHKLLKHIEHKIKNIS